MNNTRFSEEARNVGLRAFAKLVDAGRGPGVIEIYQGNQPATADEDIRIDPVWGQRLLARLTFSRPAFGEPYNGVIGARPIAESLALATGTPSWARLSDGDGRPVIDIDVGERSAALNLPRLEEGAPVAIDALVVRLPV
jgi:hypothetical protein